MDNVKMFWFSVAVLTLGVLIGVSNTPCLIVSEQEHSYSFVCEEGCLNQLDVLYNSSKEHYDDYMKCSKMCWESYP